MMKEKRCNECNSVYSTPSYTDELRPGTLCPNCTAIYLFRKYRQNKEQGKVISVSPNYGLASKHNRTKLPSVKKLVTA